MSRTSQIVDAFKLLIGTCGVFVMVYSLFLWGTGRDVPPSEVADALEAGADGIELIQEALAFATLALT